MPYTLQDYLVTATRKAADDLAAALLRLPEDKRGWNPEGKGRTALDQVAECAVLNGYMAELIQTRTWEAGWLAGFPAAKAEAAGQGWEALHARLQENTARVADAIADVHDEALSEEIALPGWTTARTMTVAEAMTRSYWNMTYHQGQINYIGSLLP